jgi:hypothetical protein
VARHLLAQWYKIQHRTFDRLVYVASEHVLNAHGDLEDVLSIPLRDWHESTRTPPQKFCPGEQRHPCTYFYSFFINSVLVGKGANA